MRLTYTLVCLSSPLLFVILTLVANSSSASKPKGSYTIRLPGSVSRSDTFDTDLDDHDETQGLMGMGREFSLFDLRRKKHNNIYEEENDDNDTNDNSDDISSIKPASASRDTKTDFGARLPYVRTNSGNDSPFPKSFPASNNRYSRPSSRSGNRSSPTFARHNNNSNNNSFNNRNNRPYERKFFRPVTDWWLANISPNVKNMPKLHCRVEPTTTLKIRKTFRPLKTIVQLGADFNTQLGVWQFKSSWEDSIIGGKLTLAGRELQISKSWQLSVGAVEDLVTRLKFRAAVDLQTWKAYARVGFRTERLSPINVMEGFTLIKQVPLDGARGHVKLEVKANFALPEPEIEYSTETQRSLIGMGDIEVNIEELNLVLDY